MNTFYQKSFQVRKQCNPIGLLYIASNQSEASRDEHLLPEVIPGKKAVILLGYNSVVKFTNQKRPEMNTYQKSFLVTKQRSYLG